ncbi:MAG: membrane protein insertase YidC [Deltaproteobacteria bacterium]|jgi:YidC/Oxa1 family membrane protein insertase|nr:membrane protein insertase YidC [Deltaproteobacteria bacterium]
MDQKRLILAIVLSIIVFVAYHLIFGIPESQKKPVEKQVQETQTPVQPAPEAAPEKDTAAPVVTEKPVSEPGVQRPRREARIVTVNTPLYQVKISEDGAVFESYVLKEFTETVASDSPLKQLLAADGSIRSMEMGFAGKSITGFENAAFDTEPQVEELSITDSPQTLKFSWQSAKGITIEKAFHFVPDSYVVGLVVTVKNQSDTTIQDHLTLALRGTAPKDTRMYGFEGPSALVDDNLIETEMDEIADNPTQNGNIKWLALQDRYFMSSLMPENSEEASLKLNLQPGKIIQAQFVQAETVIRPGTEHEYKFDIFFGPKSMRVLNSIGNQLNRALDFGWWTFLAKPCLWLMNAIHDVIPNYGITIILLTLLIKIFLWPLGAKSYKSMSEMKKIQPLMKEIREKYKDDKKKMNEEVMALYRTYKINPLGGCLPMVFQIPVFFALYRMLYQAIELRHAPFFLWINDLSAPDRLFNFGFSIPFMEPPYGIPVLTLVMGASMILQQKMSPPMGDPAQAKMMMLMPVVFTVIFINFSSGLVLYWLVNNIFSIAQQYYTQKKAA